MHLHLFSTFMNTDTLWWYGAGGGGQDRYKMHLKVACGQQVTTSQLWTYFWNLVVFGWCSWHWYILKINGQGLEFCNEKVIVCCMVVLAIHCFQTECIYFIVFSIFQDVCLIEVNFFMWNCALLEKLNDGWVQGSHDGYKLHLKGPFEIHELQVSNVFV